ncbi:MAG TPA: tripartite tricarboxylate transporter substrate binding protein [Burkholderiales bacterium]|nr:tripartite tricarboxylate transporter substrate binding protein [Burkholderiales bacterium]
MFAAWKMSVSCSLVLIAAISQCGAQTYPARPIRAIVPYAAGGGVDVVARLIAPRLGERLGQQVVIDNRPGATGNIGAELASRAAPDGYTVLIAGASIAINVSLYRKLAYDLVKDFAAVTSIAVSPNIVLVHPSLPARSIAELIALARARPGQLNYASGGSGSTLHLTAELFKSMTGIVITHIPYKGTGPALIAVISGESEIVMPPLAGTLAHVESGRLRALAVTSASRLKMLPQLPTVAEAGVPGFESGQWYGVFVPAATPPDVVTRLQIETARVVRLPDVVEQITQQGSIATGETPEQFAAHVRQEIAKWAKVVKASGAHPE